MFFFLLLLSISIFPELFFLFYRCIFFRSMKKKSWNVLLSCPSLSCCFLTLSPRSNRPVWFLILKTVLCLVLHFENCFQNFHYPNRLKLRLQSLFSKQRCPIAAWLSILTSRPPSPMPPAKAREVFFLAPPLPLSSMLLPKAVYGVNVGSLRVIRIGHGYGY